MDLLVDSIRANKIRGEARKAIQLDLSTKLDELRILIRLTKDLRFISISQYQYAAEKINELGRMLKGWIRANRNGDK